MVVVAVAIILDSSALGFMEITLAKHLEQFNIQVPVGVVFLVPSGLYAITAPVWGYVGDRFVS